MNRPLFSASVGIDKATTKPLSRAYRKLIPAPIRKGVSNFFRNLTTPRSVVNNFLQGKPAKGFSEFGRLLFNSTLGIGGLIDVATLGGMEDFFF